MKVLKKILVLVFWIACVYKTEAKEEAVKVDLSAAKPIIVERQKELLAYIDKTPTFDLQTKAEAIGKLAMFYYVHDYVDAAIGKYTKVIQLLPNSAKWHYLIGVAYKNKGDFQNVIKHFETSWKLNNRYLPVMVYLAEIYVQQGRFDEAKEIFNQVLSIDNNHTRAMVGRGQVHMLEGESEKAISLYKKAFQLQPEANQIHFLLSSAYASLGDMEQSQKHAKLKGQNQAQMFDPIITALNQESRSYTYYNDKAVQAFKAGDILNSERLAKTAIKYDNESPYPKITLANIYAATDRVDQAKKIMLSAQKGNEELVTIPYMLGALEEIQGDFKKAISWLEKAEKNDPYHKLTHEKLIANHMRLNDFESAENQILKHQKFEPDSSSSMHRLAVIHAHQNKCKPASDEIYQAVKLNPRDFDILLSFIKIAVHCEVYQQMLSDALNAARNIYKHSQDSIVVEILAMIEAKNNNFHEAIDYQAQAIFQQLAEGKSKDSETIKNLKFNLELYKNNKYPQNLFHKNDRDLKPLVLK